MLSGLENPVHLLLLLLLIILLFGARRLPEIGRSLGTGMREFKESITGRAADSGGAVALTPTSPEAEGCQQVGDAPNTAEPTAPGS
jgi:sec-independent protein translocase protein TatA